MTYRTIRVQNSVDEPFSVSSIGLYPGERIISVYPVLLQPKNAKYVGNQLGEGLEVVLLEVLIGLG